MRYELIDTTDMDSNEVASLPGVGATITLERDFIVIGRDRVLLTVPDKGLRQFVWLQLQ